MIDLESAYPLFCMNKALTAIFLQLAIIGAVPVTYFAYPVIFVRLVTEDNWGEFATSVALLVASILFAICYRLSSRRKWTGWNLSAVYDLCDRRRSLHLFRFFSAVSGLHIFQRTRIC